MASKNQKVVGLREFAAMAGVAESAMRKYHYRSNARRREIAAGKAEKMADWMLPEPDVTIGQSPGWFEQTARNWIESRPRKAHPA